MIILVTGKPGHGKTLYTVSKIKERFSDRVVYYHNIKDLKLEWIHLDDPKKWGEAPPGSVIVIDEAQHFFPVRTKDVTPDYVQLFATHRHQGFDIVLITQDPKNIDVFIRRLVGEHIHVERKLGSQTSMTFTWPRVQEDTTDRYERGLSSKAIFSFPKDSFKDYHSAEVHTVKRKIPWQFFAIPLLLLLIPAIGYFVYYTLIGKHTDAKPDQKIDNQISPGFPASSGAGNLKPKLNYIQARTPIAKDLPQSAPIYESVIQPTTAPYPAACVRFSTKKESCRCYTQQGTRLDVSPEFCNQVVANGFFVDWETGEVKAKEDSPFKRDQPVKDVLANSTLNKPMPDYGQAPGYFARQGSPLADAQ